MSRKNPFPKGLFKRITTRVIFPGVRRAEKTHYAGKGRAWTAEAEQKMLHDQADLLGTRYPEWDWKMVEVEPHVFNFIAEKRKDEGGSVKDEVVIALVEALSKSLCALALSIDRLAATQEKPQNGSKIGTWGTAAYDSTDPQTKALREVEVERERVGNRRAAQAPSNRRS